MKMHYRAPTEKAREYYRVIRAYYDEYGYSPTLRELADALGVKSTSSVDKELGILEDAGWILRPAGKVRGIVPVHYMRAEARI